MPFTDQQRSTIQKVDGLLNRLGCDIAIGPAPEATDAIRVAFIDLAVLLRTLGATELTTVADSLITIAPAPSTPIASPSSTPTSRTRGRRGAPRRASRPAAPRSVCRRCRSCRPRWPTIRIRSVLASDPEMTQMFVAEALDHLGTIEATVLELETAPQDKRLLDDVFRPFHTIKGNAGALGVVSVQEFAHHVENLLDFARAGKHRMGAEEFEIVLQAVDVLTTMIGELPARVAGQPASDTGAICGRLVARIERSIAGESAPAGVSAADAAPRLEAVTADEPSVETRQRRTRGRRPVGEGRHAQARQPGRHGRRARDRAVDDLRGSARSRASPTSG